MDIKDFMSSMGIDVYRVDNTGVHKHQPVHSDTKCTIYKDKVLPDENGNCSLCGAKLESEA